MSFAAGIVSSSKLIAAATVLDEAAAATVLVPESEQQLLDCRHLHGSCAMTIMAVQQQVLLIETAGYLQLMLPALDLHVAS